LLERSCRTCDTFFRSTEQCPVDRIADFQAFVAIVDKGSLTAAAKQLGRSLQSISRSLATLEGDLGVELIARTTRRSAATEAGLAFYRRVGAALSEIEAAKLETSNRRSEPVGLLRITCSTVFAPLYVVPAVCAFLESHPKVDIDPRSISTSICPTVTSISSAKASISPFGSASFPIRASKPGGWPISVALSSRHRIISPSMGDRRYQGILPGTNALSARRRATAMRGRSFSAAGSRGREGRGAVSLERGAGGQRGGGPGAGHRQCALMAGAGAGRSRRGRARLDPVRAAAGARARRVASNQIVAGQDPIIPQLSCRAPEGRAPLNSKRCGSTRSSARVIATEPQRPLDQ
jgi:Bacterial regulatory helix-turn-helix protein, lysR family